MSAVNITNVTVLDNPASFLAPFQFEISYECLAALKDGNYATLLGFHFYVDLGFFISDLLAAYCNQFHLILCFLLFVCEFL